MGKKTAVFFVRIEPELRERIVNYCNEAGLTLSEFLRAGLDRAVQKIERSRPRQIVHAADPELVREVARIGNNLNQIARRVNAGDADCREVAILLAGIERDVSALLEVAR